MEHPHIEQTPFGESTKSTDWSDLRPFGDFDFGTFEGFVVLEDVDVDPTNFTSFLFSPGATGLHTGGGGGGACTDS